MENIKESFQNVKQDINDLKYKLNELKSFVDETRERMFDLCEIIENLSKNKTKEAVGDKTDRQMSISNTQHNQTDNSYISPLNDNILGISTGNQGVQTDRQTDRQTDKLAKNDLDLAVEMLNSLDNIKKEIRLKFKRLTEQEILVFSAIYQLEGEIGYSNYKSLARRLNLSESSIRDYVGRLLKKGISIEKRKINNKEIQIIIAPKLKKIASLNTILELREI